MTAEGQVYECNVCDNIVEALFMNIAEKAKTNCPVSKALANVEIHLAAELNR